MSTNSDKTNTSQSKMGNITKTLEQKIREQNSKSKEEKAARVAAENQTLLTVEPKKSEKKEKMENEKSPVSNKNKEEKKNVGSEKDPIQVQSDSKKLETKKEEPESFQKFSVKPSKREAIQILKNWSKKTNEEQSALLKDVKFAELIRQATIKTLEDSDESEEENSAEENTKSQKKKIKSNTSSKKEETEEAGVALSPL